ncbi:pyruvate ferredoxin oxidoreductase [Prevotella pallens]|uniref:pyruvate ferredoxin oxidoreductase n=1 Tax=Prevotella pallens TaxID=60133 RepID=UPI001CB1F959|nr:pyruvate ferredoxin oxidoreductase [Prevotella pallens]MBF1501376.1 pyruvate ferredoxin oxidoreductase [Prevotella pallens]
MDYKYIEQLLERYWHCETSLQEEEILRLFFSQEEVPTNLVPYKDLFIYEQEQKETDILGDDFNQKILEKANGDQPVKARTITMRKRLMPLFKAAAVVAILLTLQNALQETFTSTTPSDQQSVEVPHANKEAKGPAVAKADSTKVDSTQKVSTITDTEYN